MAKGAIILTKDIIEIKNIEIYEYCLLNTATGKKEFLNKPISKGFKGSYFKDNDTFFAIYPTLGGPRIFYKEKNYALNKELTIIFEVNGINRKFKISEYEIEISYIESQYMGLDSWSEEVDVDLFYMIAHNYKDENFYNKFTLKN